MDSKTYISNALKTESHVDQLKIDLPLLTSALELYIASTEILDVMKKVAFYNNQKKMEALPYLVGDARRGLETLEHVLKDLNEGVFDAEYPEGINTRVAHGVIGICTEGGELAECFLENLEGEELDTVNLIEELFDSDWYKAIISDELDISWEENWQKNIDKLKARFGDKFSEERANNRNTDEERKILEQ